MSNIIFGKEAFPNKGIRIVDLTVSAIYITLAALVIAGYVPPQILGYVIVGITASICALTCFCDSMLYHVSGVFLPPRPLSI